MLETIKMNEKFYRQLLKDIAFQIMMSVYPEYEVSSSITLKADTGFGKDTIQPATSVDYATEEQALNFVEKLVNLGSLEAIKKFCDDNKMQEYYPTDEAGYIEYTYNEMSKPSEN